MVVPEILRPVLMRQSWTPYIFGKRRTADAIRFSVFNSTNNKKAARALQNDFIKAAIDQFATSVAIQYTTPDYISIKDTLFIE